MATRGRPGFLDDPENVETVALAYVNGVSVPKMAESFGKHARTISHWRRDPRVRAKASELARARILQVVRKTDSVIEKRLENTEDLTVQEILAIRKEFIAGPGFQDESAGISPETITEVTEKIEADPTFAEGLAKLLETPA